MTSSDPQPTGRPNARMRQTVGDMLRSLLVVGAFIAVLLIVTWRPQPEAVKVVDTAPIVSLAVAQAEFPVGVPTGLDEGWRPTSVRWEPTAKSGVDDVLHIGYVTPSDEYAQVSQSLNSTPAYIAEQTDQGVEVGSQAVGADSWLRMESPDRVSLVRTEGDATVIVSGTAGMDELIALAGSLQRAPARS